MIWHQAYSKATCRDCHAVNDLAAEGVKRNGAGVHTFTNISSLHLVILMKYSRKLSSIPILKVMEQSCNADVKFSGISPVPVLRNLTFPRNRNLKIKIAIDEIP